MILAAAVGYGLEQFSTLESAILPAILVGLFVAMLVPAKSACAISLPKPKADASGDATG